MYIDDIIWLEQIIEKLAWKHRITQEEVEEVFYNGPRIRRGPKGHIQGEDVYYAYGQTDNGRYVLVVFIYKRTREAVIISARDMEKKERTFYDKT